MRGAEQELNGSVEDLFVPFFRCSFIPFFRCLFIPFFRCSFVPSFGVRLYLSLGVRLYLSFDVRAFLATADRRVECGTLSDPAAVGCGVTFPSTCHASCLSVVVLVAVRWRIIVLTVPSTVPCLSVVVLFAVCWRSC